MEMEPFRYAEDCSRTHIEIRKPTHQVDVLRRRSGFTLRRPHSACFLEPSLTTPVPQRFLFLISPPYSRAHTLFQSQGCVSRLKGDEAQGGRLRRLSSLLLQLCLE